MKHAFKVGDKVRYFNRKTGRPIHGRVVGISTHRVVIRDTVTGQKFFVKHDNISKESI